MLVIVIIGLVFSSYWQPRGRHGVLAYATDMSVSDLLSQTNQQRAANGVSNLSLNSELDQAAQTKANDMVARNYWSHNTPDGSPPWVFITNAGYQYKSAGENLAYGFLTSSETISGWMNSPEHKANLLNNGFSEVGFGFANSPNFNGSGQETVIVAMYASPLIVAAPAPAAPSPVATTTPTPASSVPPAATATPSTTTTTQTTPVSPPPNTPATTKSSSAPPTVLKNEPQTVRVTRLTAFTGGSTPWVASMISLVTIAAIGALFLKHGLKLRRTLLRGEKYVLGHMAFDLTVISLVALCVVVTRTAGFIR